MSSLLLSRSMEKRSSSRVRAISDDFAVGSTSNILKANKGGKSGTLEVNDINESPPSPKQQVLDSGEESTRESNGMGDKKVSRLHQLLELFETPSKLKHASGALNRSISRSKSVKAVGEQVDDVGLTLTNSKRSSKKKSSRRSRKQKKGKSEFIERMMARYQSSSSLLETSNPKFSANDAVDANIQAVQEPAESHAVESVQEPTSFKATVIKHPAVSKTNVMKPVESNTTVMKPVESNTTATKQVELNTTVIKRGKGSKHQRVVPGSNKVGKIAREKSVEVDTSEREKNVKSTKGLMNPPAHGTRDPEMKISKVKTTDSTSHTKNDDGLVDEVQATILLQSTTSKSIPRMVSSTDYERGDSSLSASPVEQPARAGLKPDENRNQRTSNARELVQVVGNEVEHQEPEEKESNMNEDLDDNLALKAANEALIAQKLEKKKHKKAKRKSRKKKKKKKGRSSSQKKRPSTKGKLSIVKESLNESLVDLEENITRVNSPSLDVGVSVRNLNDFPSERSIAAAEFIAPISSNAMSSLSKDDSNEQQLLSLPRDLDSSKQSEMPTEEETVDPSASTPSPRPESSKSLDWGAAHGFRQRKQTREVFHNVVACNGEDALGMEVVDRIVALYNAKRVGSPGDFRFRLAVSGGPRFIALLIQRIVARSVDVDFNNWYFCLVGDKYTKVEGEMGELQKWWKLLLRRTSIPINNVQGIYHSLPLQACAKAYEMEIQREFELESNWELPEFDVVLVGVEHADGRVGNIIGGQTPLVGGTPRFEEETSTNWVVAFPKTEQVPYDRISLTIPAINAAKNVFLVAVGKDSEPVIQQVLQEKGKSENLNSTMPVSKIMPTHGRLTWMYVDETLDA